MSEIKIGEYVRTGDGYIGKLVEIIPKALNNLKIDIKREIRHCDNSVDNYIYTRYGFQLKHSKNIIDLIEIGDYVNGKLIHYVLGNSKNGETMICYGNGKHFSNEQIKSIVTKEVFASGEYRVETD